MENAFENATWCPFSWSKYGLQQKGKRKQNVAVKAQGGVGKRRAARAMAQKTSSLGSTIAERVEQHNKTKNKTHSADLKRSSLRSGMALAKQNAKQNAARRAENIKHRKDSSSAGGAPKQNANKTQQKDGKCPGLLRWRAPARTKRKTKRGGEGNKNQVFWRRWPSRPSTKTKQKRNRQQMVATELKSCGNQTPKERTKRETKPNGRTKKLNKTQNKTRPTKGRRKTKLKTKRAKMMPKPKQTQNAKNKIQKQIQNKNVKSKQNVFMSHVFCCV
jgi:hypothetical protein